MTGADVRVFISYRRADTGAASRQLAEALTSAFGAGHAFFDVDGIDAGDNWREVIDERLRMVDVLLVVIGRAWVSCAEDHRRRTVSDPFDTDVLRAEVEVALQRDLLVVPVLVDGADMPRREQLARPFRPIVDLEAVELRDTSWHQDVGALATALERRVLERRAGDSETETARVSSGNGASVALAPHCADIAQCLLDGPVVPILGSGANSIGWDPASAGADALPPHDEVARRLARRFGLEGDTADLACVSQQVLVSRGEAELHRALRAILIRKDSKPGPVQAFLARLPRVLRGRGCEQYQLIVTANYDETLERAFDGVHEPFDLVVFMARGEHAGRFLHVPWWDANGNGGRPRPISVPNAYGDLPIDEDGVLSRTVIVKVHGGVVHDAPADIADKHNFVLTEDDFIRLLSRGTIERLVPMQILSKLKESHLLFLGYAIQDWTLRVFLRRTWNEYERADRSWAVQSTVDAGERDFWKEFNADHIDLSLTHFVSAIESHLSATPP
jgi:hypothetical protein